MIIELRTFELAHKKFAEYIKVRSPYKWQTDLRNEACFIYWLNGKNRLYSNDLQVDSGGKDALLLRCGAYIDEVFSGEQKEVEDVIIHFYPELLRSIFQNDLPPSFVEKEPAKTPLYPKLQQHILLDKYVDNLLFYFQHPELVDEDLLNLKMKELVLLLSKTQQRKTLKEIFRYLFTSEELSLKKVIESNLYNGLSLKELAYLSQRSLATFRRDFQKYYHTTPSQYIKHRKLEKAALLLLSTEMRINDIIFECGFVNASDFTKVFHQKYGVSPSVYRLSKLTK